MKTPTIMAFSYVLFFSSDDGDERRGFVPKVSIVEMLKWLDFVQNPCKQWDVVKNYGVDYFISL